MLYVSLAFLLIFCAHSSPTATAQWPKLRAQTKLLHDRGVLLTVGTDTPTP